MNSILQKYTGVPAVAEDAELLSVSKIPAVVEYDEGVGDEICELLSAGNALYEVAKMAGKPSLATMLKWSRNHLEFAQKLAQANDIFWELQMLKVFANIAAPLKSSIGASNQIAKLKLEWEAVRVMASKFSSKLDERSMKGIELTTSTAKVQVIDYSTPNP